jgi:uncharacterized delta-60 repeat protein
MFTTRSRSTRSLRARVGIAAASAAALAVPFLGATPAGAAAGDLDTGFSGDGLQAGIVGSKNATASFLQLDSKVVVAGTGNVDADSVNKVGTYVARYDQSGNLDTTYGDGGVKQFNVFPGYEYVRDVAPAGAGSVVVGYGTATYPDEADIFVAKLTSAGQLDTTFGGGDGIVTMNLGNHDRAAAVVVKGTRTYVAASVDDGGNWATKWTLLALNSTTGALDTTFSGDGKAEVPTSKFNTYDSLRDLAIQADGKFVLGGTSASTFAVARLTSAGALDTTFSGDGVATAPVERGGAAYKVLIQKDNKIVLAGYAYSQTRSDTDMAAVRFTAAGALDTTFSGDGKVMVDGGSKLNDTAFSAALAKDDKVVLGGFIYNSAGMDFGVARLNWNGTQDASFSGDGVASTSTLATSNEQIESITMAPNDRILGIGENLNGWSMAAYQGNASPTLTINDVSLNEPDSATANMTFKVKLSAASTSAITVKYTTTAGTAKAPGDYTTKTGTLTIAAGKTSGTVVVPVVGDTVKEANETFTVNLSQPTNAGIADASGTGTIVNED